MLFLRSALFTIWFAAITLVMGVLALPLLLGPRWLAVCFSAFWARTALWGLKVFARIDMRITGAVPKGPFLVASKHMSTWDTLAIYVVLVDPGIVLKRSLLLIPFFGWFVGKTTAIPIDRAAGASALRSMTKAAQDVLSENRPVDYKPGVAGLYGQLGVACVPVAHNSGAHWRGFWKHPGTITLAFLEPIPLGLKRAQFMPILEERIETATRALLA